jgi:hypothetical protein
MLFVLYLTAIAILILGQSRGLERMHGPAADPTVSQRPSPRSDQSLEIRFRRPEAA